MIRQKGFTLIELLIGIFLSTVVSVAMLMFFKQSMHVSLESTQASEADAKIQTSLITMKKIVQIAGFGNGEHEDIQIGAYSTLPALMWRFATTLDPDTGLGTAFQCRGVGEVIDDYSGTEKLHRFVLLKRASCNSTEDITTGVWQLDQQLASMVSEQTTPMITFALDNASCTPFGIDSNNGIGKKTLTITADSAPVATKITVCLTNIVAEL